MSRVAGENVAEGGLSEAMCPAAANEGAHDQVSSQSYLPSRDSNEGPSKGS